MFVCAWEEQRKRRKMFHSWVIIVVVLVSSLDVSMPLSMRGICWAWMVPDKQGWYTFCLAKQMGVHIARLIKAGAELLWILISFRTLFDQSNYYVTKKSNGSITGLTKANFEVEVESLKINPNSCYTAAAMQHPNTYNREGMWLISRKTQI